MRDKLKLLYVDDEVINLFNFTLLFQDQFEIITAESAKDVLELLEHEKDIAIAVSEQRMAYMEGVEILRKVRAQIPDVVCIVFTTFIVTEDILDAIREGRIMTSFPKPWDVDKLEACLGRARDTYLRGRSATPCNELVVAVDVARHP